MSPSRDFDFDPSLNPDIESGGQGLEFAHQALGTVQTAATEMEASAGAGADLDLDEAAPAAPGFDVEWGPKHIAMAKQMIQGLLHADRDNLRLIGNYVSTINGLRADIDKSKLDNLRLRRELERYERFSEAIGEAHGFSYPGCGPEDPGPDELEFDLFSVQQLREERDRFKALAEGKPQV